MFKLIISVMVLVTFKVYGQDSLITVEQIGDNNSVTINQQGIHSILIEVGKSVPSNNNLIDIQQLGTGLKTTSIKLPDSNFNNLSILQDGAGNHTANIQNLAGNNNTLNLTQTGTGDHTFTLIGSGTSSNNTITANQSGNSGANKTFTLNLNALNATVNVQQTNPNIGDSGSMTVNCNPCGSYSYTKY